MIENFFIECGKRKKKEENEELEEGKRSNKLARNNILGKFDDISILLSRRLEPEWRRITAENLELQYSILFKAGDAYKMFKFLEKEIEYEKESKVQVFGKWHQVPRKQASFGDYGLKYTFSGTTVTAEPWTPFLEALRDMLVNMIGVYFNFVLINRYKDGIDHMGEHKDDEKELIAKSPIASLSFGQERQFVFRHQDSRGAKATRKIEPVKLCLQSGSILLMNHPTNSFWYHSLPIRKNCRGPRINLTFRQMHTRK